MFMSGGAAIAVAAALHPDRVKAEVSYGPPVQFSWEALQSWAEVLSQRPFDPHVPRNRELIRQIDYDAHQQIRYRPDASILPTPDSYPVQLFHVGRYAMDPVRMFIVRDGESREVLYSTELFSYGTASFAKALTEDTGFAGFRIMRHDNQPDWISFLGASYFRTTGETMQYGLSARGLALNIGMPEPEEFPRFTNFWIEGLEGQDGILIYALLESPSVSGAYRISAVRGTGAITGVDLVLHARTDVHRLGIAPLTSMFWYGKTNRLQGTDWRPEIHDSDGLALWTGSGENIWRPINNPPVTKLSSFLDNNPKGFGLIQRERNFDAYQDDGVFYNRRPSVWVEPTAPWGEGAVQLLEIPTDDETKDNIVAFWNPASPLKASDRLSMSYRIYWQNYAPFQHGNGRVVATRRGDGGIPGGDKRMGVTKYVADFDGGNLAQLTNTDGVTLHLSASRGTCDAAVAYRVVDTPRWRILFDYTPVGDETGDIRAYLEKDGKALTETWMYQHVEGPERNK